MSSVFHWRSRFSFAPVCSWCAARGSRPASGVVLRGSRAVQVPHLPRKQDLLSAVIAPAVRRSCGATRGCAASADGRPRKARTNSECAVSPLLPSDPHRLPLSGSAIRSRAPLEDSGQKAAVPWSKAHGRRGLRCEGGDHKNGSVFRTRFRGQKGEGPQWAFILWVANSGSKNGTIFEPVFRSSRRRERPRKGQTRRSCTMRKRGGQKKRIGEGRKSAE